jgi:hypothetical protein
MKKQSGGDAVREYLSEIGRRGGEVKTKKGFSTLTPEQRTAIAKKAAAVRWGKKGSAASKKRLHS